MSESNAKPIKKSEIKQLHNCYVQHTAKLKDGEFKPIDDTDTKSGWFSLTEILDFLKGNNVDINKPDEYGIRIYLGYHHPDNNFKPTKIVDGEEVENDSNFYKDTFILVVTKKEGTINQDVLQDDLKLTDAVAYGVSGQGLDNAHLCPPETGCGGSGI